MTAGFLKMTRDHFRGKNTLAFGLGLLSLIGAASCGKTDNPKIVEIDKLKPAMNLQVLPTSDGVELSWTANNNESDFSGFNIYISEAPFETLKTDLALTQSATDPQAATPVVFQDAKGNEIEGLKAKLAQHFNFDAKTKQNVDASAAKTYAPYIRCNVADDDKGGVCLPVTDESKANEKKRANGLVTHRIMGLTAGKSYSFFVAATSSSGKKIQSPTSSVMMASPRATYSVTIPFTTETAKSGLKLGGTAPNTVVGNVTLPGFPYCVTTPAEAVHVYFEINDRASGKGKLSVVGANGSRISDLGPVADIKSKLLVVGSDTAPLLNNLNRLSGTGLVPPPSDLKIPSDGGDLGVSAGYSRCGESVFMLPGHLYSIAYLDGATTRYALFETPAAFVNYLDTPTDGVAYTAPAILRFAVAKAGERKL